MTAAAKLLADRIELAIQRRESPTFTMGELLSIVGALRLADEEDGHGYVNDRQAALREAAKIARDSYPQNSDYDPRFKIAGHSIAGTLERMADGCDISGEKQA